MTTAPAAQRDLTVPSEQELVERARAMREELLARQEEAERLTHIPVDIHEKFLANRFYDMFVPKLYGVRSVSVAYRSPRNTRAVSSRFVPICTTCPSPRCR